MRSTVGASMRLLVWVVVLAVVHVGAPPAWATPSDGAWGAVPPPTGRYGQAAIYDPVRDRMIVFGGTTSGTGVSNTFNQVWTLELAGPAVWHLTEVAGTPPSGRYRQSMIYDPIRDRVLVFGGYDNNSLLNEVWALTLSGTPAWTKLTPSGTPPVARYDHVAAYDPVGDRMLVFGGLKAGSVALNDLWALSLSGAPAWSPLAPAGAAPAARGAASMVFDPAHGRLVVFGGFNGGYLGDAWALSLAAPMTWAPIAAGGTPPSARAYHSATFDASRDEMVVFAGYDGTYRNDAFALSFAGTPQWAAVSTPGGAPGGRMFHSAIHDPVRDRDIVFAGASDALMGDLWELSRSGTPTWDQLPASNEVELSPRSSSCVVRDTQRDRLVLFGGVSGQGVPFNDVLTMSLTPGHGWSPLTVVGTPPSPRYGASAIYDPVRDRVLIYGGGNNTGVRYDELWELSLSGAPTWTRRFPGGLTPSGKFFPTAILDPVRDRMVMFGGLNSTSGTLAQTWGLSLSEPMTWAPVNASNPPSDRYAASALYDAARDRMVVFGGGISNQVYALQLSSPPSWTLLAEGGPIARGNVSAVYDAARQRMVVFGGYNNLTYPTDVWAYDLAAAGGWMELHPDGPVPAGRAGSAALYDPDRDRMVVVGGANYGTSNAYNDVLSIQWSGVLGIGPGPSPATAMLAAPRPNPARDGVDIAFALPTGGHARLRLYDVSGRLVRSFLDGELPAGPNLVRWDRRDDHGRLVPAGLYLVDLQAGSERLSRRVVVND